MAGRKLSFSDIAYIRRARRLGFRVEDIARVFGVVPQTIWTHTSDMKEFKQKPGPRMRYDRSNLFDYAEIGMTYKEMTIATGVAIGTICKVLNKPSQ
jgi:hypothetical protein